MSNPIILLGIMMIIHTLHIKRKGLIVNRYEF